MRIADLFFSTLRDVPTEADLVSHQLLLRGGFIRKLSAGVYSYLPLGYRVLRNIEQIVRDEMDAAGGQELLMPAVHPSELWKETGRWDEYGDLLAKLKDHQGREFCIGPTHEEVITDLVRNEVSSYRQLPLLLYQIQTKYRDEMRPRGGLIRAKEFVMKDLYSFDRDAEGLEISYQRMFEAYCRIFDRCSLSYRVVEAEGGTIGGTDTREFMVPNPSGEDVMLYCPQCGYAANRELAQYGRPPFPLKPDPKTFLSVEKASTPGMKTVKDVTEFLSVPPSQLVKTLLYAADGEIVAALVRGDREINEAKLKRTLQCADLVMADAKKVEEVSRAPVGFAGPVGLAVRMIADFEVQEMFNFVVGANEADAHLVNVNLDRDFEASQFFDLRFAVEGDQCPTCSASLRATHCIEVGHIFKLGTKYSKLMNANYTDATGAERPIIMGCYGIGVSRIMAALVESSHDENGIIWPASLSPFHAVLLQLEPNDAALGALASELLSGLKNLGLDVLLDDRDERAGVKFKDADLIGVSLQVVLGRKCKETGKIEVQVRRDKSRHSFDRGSAPSQIADLRAGLLKDHL